MMVDSLIAVEAINLRLPVALANLRSEKAASIQIVTIERTNDRNVVAPHPSSYV